MNDFTLKPGRFEYYAMRLRSSLNLMFELDFSDTTQTEEGALLQAGGGESLGSLFKQVDTLAVRALCYCWAVGWVSGPPLTFTNTALGWRGRRALLLLSIGTGRGSILLPTVVYGSSRSPMASSGIEGSGTSLLCTRNERSSSLSYLLWCLSLGERMGLWAPCCSLVRVEV